MVIDLQVCEYPHLIRNCMSLELSVIRGIAFGIEYLNGEDAGDDDVGVYVVVDLGFLRLLFTTFK